MSQAKIIKIPGGDAFIEIGLDYIRIGTGDNNFILLDKSAINASANTVNWQLSPEKMTYYGLLTHVNPILGALPISPKYSISTAPISALVGVATRAASISSAVGI
jgi:hypothetical protein